MLTDGTTTKTAILDVNSVVIRFSECYFSGDLNGDLIYSNGQNLDFDRCTWQLNNANIYALNLDCYNQNTGITDCRLGGVGKGVRVTNLLTPGFNRVEGLRVHGSYFINTGASNLELGNSLFTTIMGNVLDQSSIQAVAILNGADNVMIMGNYLGSSNVSGATGVYIAPNAGHGHGIRGNTLSALGYGVFCDANSTVRISSVSISDNVFSGVLNPLILDSVRKCIVTGNIDMTVPANGSINTKGSFGPGEYTISNNAWGVGSSALWHSTSIYHQSLNTYS